jgi:hypothetical protein
MKKILIFFCLSILVFDSHCQDKYALINEIKDLSAIESAKEVTYYGLDFSLLKFISPSNSYKDQAIKEQYLGAWLVFFQEGIPEKYLRNMLKFKEEEFVYNQYSVQSRMDSISKDWIVVTPLSISKEQVFETIKSYNLPDKDGLGFVIHPVIFDEVSKDVYCFFTFFNIRTKEIFWIVETKEKGMGAGLKKNYGYGMTNATQKYLNEVYRKILKR